MSIKHHVLTLVVTTTAMVATALVGAAGVANSAPDPSSVPTSSVATNSTPVGAAATMTPEVAKLAKDRGLSAQDALAAYWTPARMKAAKPDSELPAVKAASQKAAEGKSGTATVADLQGESESIAGTGSTTMGEAGVSSDVSTEAYQPGYPVGHPTARTNGKIFFTLSGGNYVCSGSIVNSEGKATVWTAGHCLSGNGVFASNWCFVPNYYPYNQRPYGTWCASQLWSLNGWIYNGDFDYDVGAAIIYRQFGYCIVNYLGGQGIAWNYPIGQYVYAFGYPAGSPFDGERLWAEQGYTSDGAGFVFPDPGTIYMVNNMTGGSSGGPWLMNFDGNWGLINGHNDFKFTAYQQYMFSPYYGNQVASLYNTVRNMTC